MDITLFRKHLARNQKLTEQDSSTHQVDLVLKSLKNAAASLTAARIQNVQDAIKHIKQAHSDTEANSQLNRLNIGNPLPEHGLSYRLHELDKLAVSLIGLNNKNGKFPTEVYNLLKQQLQFLVKKVEELRKSLV